MRARSYLPLGWRKSQHLRRRRLIIRRRKSVRARSHLPRGWRKSQQLRQTTKTVHQCPKRRRRVGPGRHGTRSSSKRLKRKLRSRLPTKPKGQRLMTNGGSNDQQSAVGATLQSPNSREAPPCSVIQNWHPNPLLHLQDLCPAY